MSEALEASQASVAIEQSKQMEIEHFLLVDRAGIEPATSALQRQRSTVELSAQKRHQYT